jgi:hypothetical protein
VFLWDYDLFCRNQPPQEIAMYHDTLNQALDAAGPSVKELWPLGSNIAYGQTVRHVVETGSVWGRRKEPVCRVISVYRCESGRYETATTYLTA